MKRRFNLSIIACLSLILGVGPLPTLAFGERKASPLKPGDTANAAKRVENFRPSKTLASKSRPAKAAQNTSPSGQSSTLLPDGSLLLIGGETSDGPTSAAAVKYPVNDEITAVASTLNYARAWHSATLLPDGRVLIVGGVGSDGQVVPNPEFFDPATKSFEVVAASSGKTKSTITPRAHHTATMVTEGRVLLAGGMSSSGKTLKTAELWDPGTGTTAKPSGRLNSARRSHTATLLASGNVLLWGGIDSSEKPLVVGEAFDTQTQTFSEVATPPAPPEGPPQVEASTPEDGASRVPTDSFVGIRFSRPLRVDTVNSTVITLGSPHGAVVARIIPAEGGMLAFVTPETSMLPGTPYTVSLSGPTDLEGSALEPTTISFTTALEAMPKGRIWTPRPENFQGDWSSGLPKSPWEGLSPLQAAAGVTALSGQVLRVDGWPLANVTMRIGDRKTTTDDTGRFLLTDIESNRTMLIVDCRPASTRKTTYGLFMIAVDVPKRNATNVLPYTIWMPVLDTKNAVRVASPTRKALVARTPLIPGLEVHIPADTVLRDFDGNPLKSMTLTPVPVDRGPFPGPPGVQFPVFFTLQLGGTTAEGLDGKLGSGIRLVFPNYGGVPTGSRIDFWSYAADGVGWYTYGHGSVTGDGKQIVPDAGVTIHLFTCASIGSPNEPEGPVSCESDGDPVNLGTGLFIYKDTDLYLPDIIPISITRVYRPNDTKWRPFGSGTRHPYEMFLIGDQTTYSYGELVLPDGGRVHFDRYSSGTGFSGAMMEATTTPNGFYKSTLISSGTWANGNWDLKLRDGTVYRFSVDGREVAPLSAIIDRNGNTLSVVRNPGTTGNLESHRVTRVVSPNGRWVEFSYDANFHITQAKDNIGRTVSYTYDASGRLIRVTNPMGGQTEYTYDTSNRMLTIKNPRGIVYNTNEYDTNGRVSRQTHADGGVFEFAYTLDGNGKVTQTDVIDPRGNTRRVTFGSTGYALTDVHALGDPEQQTVTYERQAGTNHMLNYVDPLGRMTSYTYDSMGKLQA
jgi:YD repeat-containing protein